MRRNKLRHYKGMEGSGRVRRKRHGGVGIRGNSGGEISCGFREGGGGEEVVCKFRWFGGGGSRERIDEPGDFGFVGIAYDPGDTGKRGQLFGSTLGVAAGDDDADGRVGGVKLSDGVAGLGVGGSGDGAGVDDDDVGSSGRGGSGATAVEQLALEGGAIGLRGAATELFDEEAWHLKSPPQG
jgi:hypothetical protein